jgi:TolA-binding protein
MNRSKTIRSLLLILSILTFSALYTGCGGGEQTMSEDEMVTDTGSSDQMDSTASEKQTQSEPAPDTTAAAVVPQSAGPSNEQLQSELDSLKTENIQLQDKVNSAEQTNQDLTAKISDLEAANMAIQKQSSEKKSRKAPRGMSQAERSTSEEIAAYKDALSKFNEKNYSEVASEMQTLLKTGIKDDFADNCHYWIGLSNFQMKDYTSAISEFQQVMNYRFSEKKDDAQIMIARSYERLGDREKAMTEYKKLIDLFPTSEYVVKAQAKLR